MTQTNKTNIDTKLKNTTGSNIPTHVLVGPYRIEVKLVSDPSAHLKDTSNHASDSDLYGILKLRDEAMYISDTLSANSMADTILHETIHAMWAAVGGWGNELPEEQIVASLTTILLDTLRRNPNLIDYLVNT